MRGEFLIAINMLSSERGVSPEVVVEALESALVAAYKRNTSDTADVVARIDPATGEAKVVIGKLVAEEPSGPEEISLEAARQLDPGAQLGSMVWEEIPPGSLGRIAAQSVKQHIAQKLREAERKQVFDEFAERVGEILHGVVQRVEQRTVILELGKTEAVMPPAEQVPTERHYPGQRLRVYLVDVLDAPKGPQLLVSRAHKMMIKRLFEQEVPEIFHGTVEIKAISREPGARSKVAVVARQEGIDPVGSCVGMRGVRIQNIVTELGGEKIDVIPWAPDPGAFVASALSPAQVLQVTIDEEGKTATVVVPERQLSLAIGREGQNARLAARLTGWRIDIKSDVVAAAAGIWAGVAGEASPRDSPTSMAAEPASIEAEAPAEPEASVDAVSADAEPAPIEAEAPTEPEASVDAVSADAEPAHLGVEALAEPEAPLDVVSADAEPAPIEAEAPAEPEASVDAVSADAEPASIEAEAPAEPEASVDAVSVDADEVAPGTSGRGEPEVKAESQGTGRKRRR